MKKQSKTAQIRALLEKGLSVAQIAKKLGTSPSSVYQVRWRDEKKNARKRKLGALIAEDAVEPVQEAVEDMDGRKERTLDQIFAEQHQSNAERVLSHLAPVQEYQPDLVNHPKHYKAGGIETIDFVEAKRLGYHLGNVVKYISRAQHKGGMQDLLKAQWYLNRAIEKGEVNE